MSHEMLCRTSPADMHHGSRRVLTPSGEWFTPILPGFLDDTSRFGCHPQWYLAETAEVFVHGLCQAYVAARAMLRMVGVVLLRKGTVRFSAT